MTELPYGPFLSRTLPTLSRLFQVLNRYYVLPAIKAGLGPLHANPLTGSWMLLRTTGRTSGLKREVALGYAILDGVVYCSACWGERLSAPRMRRRRRSSPRPGTCRLSGSDQSGSPPDRRTRAAGCG